MKKTLSALIFPLFLLCCEQKEGIIGYDDIELDKYIIDNYTTDAKQLYLHEIFQDSTHANYDNPILDENEVHKILKIIQAVYDSDSPERDTVFDIYKIHGFYCYSFNSISLRVDTERPEIKNLANNSFPTGESELDNLLNSYSFDLVETSFSYPQFPWLTIYTDNEYNMIPIEKEFANLESVQIADFNKACMGDGNSIKLKRLDDSATITFSIGRGDCPAGCVYHKYWEFKVSNGKAEFIKTY